MTPIEDARNLGPVSGEELRALGIDTLERLRELGWQEAWAQWRERFPERRHLVAGYALAGAVEDADWRRLPDWLKLEVKRSRRR
ncbi:MAG: TfoX/Sxy family DNA transformation protein [Bryobacteraceae bacterium]|nr:TfoX/Sxy family DNA transformation protein [Bryobacteraceae bacterium]